jgi:hypothetical protein
MNALSEQLIQERRRSVRLRRSAMLKAKLDEIDRPNIKIAETRDELSQSFALVYKEYLDSGYITNPHPSQMHFSVYNFLPSTCVFIFRSYLTVISTLTQIFDTPLFGLPMDCLYREELDSLRAQGRKITELSALATPREVRWCNLMVFLSRTMFEYSRMNDVNDICVMVNPKHVNFYKTMFLFEDFGPERFYAGVGAPAVALRLDMDNIEQNLLDKFRDVEIEVNMYEFFCKLNSTLQELQAGITMHEKRHPMNTDDAGYFLNLKPEILEKFSTKQIDYITNIYNLKSASQIN